MSVMEVLLDVIFHFSDTFWLLISTLDQEYNDLPVDVSKQIRVKWFSTKQIKKRTLRYCFGMLNNNLSNSVSF